MHKGKRQKERTKLEGIGESEQKAKRASVSVDGAGRFVRWVL